jgi:hypothetical protein
METLQVFSVFADAWATALAGANDALMPIAMGFCYSMTIFGLALVLFSAGMRSGTGILSMGTKMLMVAGIYMVAVQNVQGFAEAALESVVQYGLAAGGVGGNAQDFLSSPDAVMAIGLEKFIQINEVTIGLCTGWYSCLGAWPVAAPMFLASVAVLIAFGIAGFTIMSAALLFHVAKLAAMLILPLAIFTPLSAIGGGPVRAAIVFMVQIFVLVLVISINAAVFSLITVSETPGWSAALPTIIASMIFIGMLLGAGRLAYSITSSATLGAGALFGAPLGMAASGARGAVGRVVATTPAAAAVSAGARNITDAISAPMPSSGTGAGNVTNAVSARRP